MLSKLLFCALLSMAPVSELRGAIPVGLAADIPVAILFPVCILANLLPVPLIILFLRRVLAWMQKRGGVLRKVADWVERRGDEKSDLYQKYAGLGLFLLVAVPLPGTGAWTGALVAALLGMRLKKALPVIGSGVLAAGIVVLLISQGVIHFAGL